MMHERQQEMLKKINEVKISRKTLEQEKQLIILKCQLRTKKDGTKGTGLKILTPKQLLQRLPIALSQVKAGNNSEHLLN